jgi:hypothetical protein
MCTTLFLDRLEFTKTLIVECDASSHGIGAVLMQEGSTLASERSQIKGKNLVKTIYEK